MRVLFKDDSDGTPLLAKVSYASYDTEESELWFSAECFTVYISCPLTLGFSFLRRLFDNSFLDLSAYPARVEWVDDDTEV